MRIARAIITGPMGVRSMLAKPPDPKPKGLSTNMLLQVEVANLGFVQSTPSPRLLLRNLN